MDWAILYWRARRLWPGDPLFSPEAFGALPAHYVYEAIAQGQELRRRELHEQELGVASLSALMANINRDTKRNKQPYKPTDFCYFADKADRNDPDAINAAAYLQLVQDGLMPNWALFIYPQMKGMAEGLPAPDPVAAIGRDFILLAPEPANGGMEGLLIAKKTVSGKLLQVKLGRQSIKVIVPEFEESVVAREHVFVAVN